MREEKILLLYPTLVRAGLAITHYMPPDPIISSVEASKTSSFYVTAVMSFLKSKRYMTELDFLYNGQSVLAADGDVDNDMKNFMFSYPSEDSLVVGSSLFIKNVNIEQPGVYDVVVSIFDDNDGKPGDRIDTSRSSFVVAHPTRTN